MDRVDTFEATVSLPFLASVRPNRAERIALKTLDCDLAIPVTHPDLLPVACRIASPDIGSNAGFFERHANYLETRHRVTIRHDGERYYQETGISVEAMLAGMRQNPFMRIGRSHLGIEAMRHTVAETAKNRLHQPVLQKLLSTPARSLLHHRLGDSTAGMLADVLAETRAIPLTDEGEMQSEAAKAAFREAMDDIVIVGDRVYVECGEPIYMVQVPLQDGMHTATIRTVDSSFWPGGGRTVIDVMQASATRYYRMDELDEILDRHPQRYDFVPIEPTRGFTSGFPLEALEFDRIARALCAEVGNVFSRRERLLSTPKAVLNAWIDFRDVLYGYNPLEGEIPVEVEGRFEEVAALLEEIDVNPIVSKADLDYARDMWANRKVTDWMPISPVREWSA